MRNSASSGVTLVEMLVLMGILSIVMTFTLVAVNPAAMIRKAKAVKRTGERKQILEALKQASNDRKNIYPTGIPIAAPGTEIRRGGYDICGLLVSYYIAALPADSDVSSPVNDCNTNYRTGYYIYQSNVFKDPTIIDRDSLNMYADDTFTRSATGSWSTATSIGGAYTLVTGTAANSAVNGNEGTMSLAANTSMYYRLGTVSARDVDARIRVKTDKLVTGTSLYTYLMVRSVATNSQYSGILIFDNLQRVYVQLYKTVGGVGTSIAGPTQIAGLTHTANTYYWLRFQTVNGTPATLQVKAWADGFTEPVAWTATATHSDATLQNAGAMGVQAFSASGVTNGPHVFTFDDYSAYWTKP